MEFTKMKMRYLMLGIVGLLLATTAVQAQNNSTANKIIKGCQDKFNSLADVTADLSYTMTNPELKKPVVKKGTVTLKKSKYAVVFADEEMYCNGKYTWVVLKGSEQEIVKNNFNPKEDLSPDRLYKLYKDDMKTDYLGEEAGAHKVVLFANHDDGDIWKTMLWINAETKLIDKAVMYARNGSQYTYVMSNIRSNTGVVDALFTLNEKKYTDQGWILTDQSED